MSLRKSPLLTAPQIAVNRRNPQRSPGPRPAEGQARARLSARHQGIWVSEVSRPSLRAVGEDPAEFDRLYHRLLTAYEPADPLWAQQVEDLARLYWRRARLERAREGILRRQLEAFEADEQRSRQEMEQASFPPSRDEMIDLDLPRLESAAARCRQTVSYLLVIRERVRKRQFSKRLAWVFHSLHPADATWRTHLMESLLRRFASDPSSGDAPGESEYAQLVELLDEDVARAREQAEQAERQAQETSAAERDARLAPTGEPWTILLREEKALDRAIDRKTRILLAYVRFRSAAGRRPRHAGEQTPSQAAASRQIAPAASRQHKIK